MKHSGTRTRAKKTATKLDRQDGAVPEFFDRFARALTAGDGREIASMWTVPALVIGDNALRAVNSLQDVEEFFSGAREQYNARGITDTRPEIFGLEWVTDRIVVVDMRWPYLDERGNKMGEEASTYTLRRDDAGNLSCMSRSCAVHRLQPET
jgi:hypothetical protein